MTKTQTQLNYNSETLAKYSIQELAEIADQLWQDAEEKEVLKDRTQAKKDYNRLAVYINERAGRKMLNKFR